MLRGAENGVVVRQVVGHGRLIGEHAYRQLDELYRALHWYVNCFQPSMKLVAKQVEEERSTRIYDAAKTPLQRALLSGVLPLSQQQELRAVTKALDPLCLLSRWSSCSRRPFAMMPGDPPPAN